MNRNHTNLRTGMLRTGLVVLTAPVALVLLGGVASASSDGGHDGSGSSQSSSHDGGGSD